MAKNFRECARSGGKVVTKKLKNGRIIKVCYDKEGKSHSNTYKPKNRQKIKPQKLAPASLSSLEELAEHFRNRSNK